MNGNIFYPEPRTLAYTDSVLLQGLAAAPLIWAGLTPMVTYTLIILASIALSGWTMFLYARHLTNRVSAALLAGIVFAFRMSYFIASGSRLSVSRRVSSLQV